MIPPTMIAARFNRRDSPLPSTRSGKMGEATLRSCGTSTTAEAMPAASRPRASSGCAESPGANASSMAASGAPTATTSSTPPSQSMRRPCSACGLMRGK